MFKEHVQFLLMLTQKKSPSQWMGPGEIKLISEITVF